MFNDALSLHQCQDLVQNMAQCAFPFQCAHGRPSIVPLTLLNQVPPPRRKDRDRERLSESSNNPQAHPPHTWSSSRLHGSEANTVYGISKSTDLDSVKWKAWRKE